jgi:energy-coupling factor transporter ATP-binding protein EcfA2
MRLRKAIIMRYRSVDYLEIEMGPLTILFGQNNVGKTNVLEAIYGILAPETMRGYPGAENLARGVRGDDTSPPVGAIYADLESGLLFDDAALEPRTREKYFYLNIEDEFILLNSERQSIQLGLLPLHQVSFVFDSVKSRLCFADPQPYFELEVNETLKSAFAAELFDYELSDHLNERCCFDEPRPRPLFLDWEFADLSDKVTAGINKVVEEPTDMAWLEEVRSDGGGSWRVKPLMDRWIKIVGELATALLPDFLDGSIRAQLQVPTRWGEAPSVQVSYEERGTGQYARSVPDVGSGAARWIAACTQIAVHALANPLADIRDLIRPDKRSFSGDVLFIDEPEAHLHHTAVASILRWCQRMAKSGFNLVVASHHEAFLRASGDDIRFVKIRRDVESSCTQARTVLGTATPLLQELATEVGMHPATVLSLQRAILFVEGPLDQAVLDEYAAPALDAAGVLIIPIHGTKNLEGLIDGEFTTRLGIKTGVLTDNTITATMLDRSNTKRTGEEKKLVRLLKRFDDQGLPPPDLFGIPEEDLLFALPAEGIRQHFLTSGSQFPGWLELLEECRQALGKGTSDSVDWKAYAEEHYDLPLTTADGVRSVVHRLDFAGVELPSIQAVVDDVIAWAKRDPSTA